MNVITIETVKRAMVTLLFQSSNFARKNKYLISEFFIGLSNLEGKIEYKDVDGILSNGFSGLFYFSKDDNVVASGKITRVPGTQFKKIS